MSHTIVIGYDDDGVEIFGPAKYEVCGRCRGEGTHWHQAFSNGISAEELSEWDDDEREGLFTGRYDVTCEECHGKRVVVVFDKESATPAQYRLFYETQKEECEYRHLVEMERRMGA